MLHYTKDDRVEHFELFGYFKEFSDKKTRQYLGHQFFEEIDTDIKIGYEGISDEVLTENTKLVSGFKDKTIEASTEEPLEVEVFYHFACGRAKK